MEEVKIHTIPWETDGTVRIIRIEGFLDTTTSQSLARRLDELLEQEVYKIVIDLEAVDYISSPGWGILVGDIRRIRENSGDLKLARMKPEVYEIYTLLGLDSFIESYDSVDEACGRFAELPLVIEQPIEPKTSEKEVVEVPPPQESRELVKSIEVPEKPEELVRTVEVPQEPERIAPPVERKMSFTEMIQEIVKEHPTYNTWQVKKELDTEKYDFTKASWFKVYRGLRRLRTGRLLTEERKLTMERRRIEEMRKDFHVERKLWEAERRLRLQKDELEKERRKLEKEKEEFAKDKEEFREEMRRIKVELKETIRFEKARQAKFMNQILDIVRKHPEYGAKRISENLKTTHLISRSSSTIYAKLRRADLNTKEKRLRFLKGDRKDAKVQP